MFYFKCKSQFRFENKQKNGKKIQNTGRPTKKKKRKISNQPSKIVLGYRENQNFFDAQLAKLWSFTRRKQEKVCSRSLGTLRWWNPPLALPLRVLQGTYHKSPASLSGRHSCSDMAKWNFSSYIHASSLGPTVVCTYSRYPQRLKIRNASCIKFKYMNNENNGETLHIHYMLLLIHSKPHLIPRDQKTKHKTSQLRRKRVVLFPQSLIDFPDCCQNYL